MGDNPSHDSDLEVSHEDQRFLRVAPMGVIMLVVSLGALAQDAESWATGPTFVSCRPTCVQTRKAFTNARVGAPALLAVLVVLFTLPGCGGGAGTGGGPATAPPPPVAISLNQTAVTIAQGEQFTFVADVTGKTNTAVSWAIQEGSSGGSITSAGIYTAPATLGTFHVIATSQADNTRHATATVTVVTLELSVSPTSDVLGPQGVRVFSIAVNSSSNPNVTWSVQEGAAGGSITTSGQYTAPKNTGSFHVVATSVHDPTKNATAGVTIVPSGFRPTGDMSAGRTGHTATLLQSGKVLMAGGDPCLFDGFYYENCPLSSAELYDPGTGTFAATGKMSVTRVSHTATLLNNGKVLVAGGHDASAELYDPTSGKFAATGSMSVGRRVPLGYSAGQWQGTYCRRRERQRDARYRRTVRPKQRDFYSHGYYDYAAHRAYRDSPGEREGPYHRRRQLRRRGRHSRTVRPDNRDFYCSEQHGKQACVSCGYAAQLWQRPRNRGLR